MCRRNKAATGFAYRGLAPHKFTIRSGFLTLFFGGWAIVLKGIVDSTDKKPSDYLPLAWGLFLFSLGFALGAWYVDRNYVRRRFRVIVALDRLTDAIRTCGGDYLKIPPELLKVAGDNAEMPFDSAGYREAAKAELSVYLVPLLILVAVIYLVVH